MTFLNVSTAIIPYGQPWIRPEKAKRLSLPIESLSTLPGYILFNKRANSTRAVFWLVSNCHSVSRREKAMEELAKYIPVEMVGQCAKNESMKNACGPSHGTGLGGPECMALFNSYPFFVAAENSLCRDYITEKYWARYNLDSVPIVMRRDVYEGRLPDGSFIAMSDFEGPQALAEYLHYLMKTPAAYMRYFDWRRQGWARASNNTPGHYTGLCRLCEVLINEEHRELRPIEDIGEWYRRESACDDGSFVEKWLTRRRNGTVGMRANVFNLGI